MKAAALIALGAIIAWLAADALRGDPVPDSRVPELQAAVDSARRVARDATAAREATERALADTVAALAEARAYAERVAVAARAEADSIAARLSDRYGGDSVAVRELRNLRAAHRREVLAERERARTWQAEARAKDLVISALHVEVSALTAQVGRMEALDVERERVNEGLRDALSRERTKHRITLAVAGVGLAILALR